MDTPNGNRCRNPLNPTKSGITSLVYADKLDTGASYPSNDDVVEGYVCALTAMVGVAGAFRTFVTAAVGGLVVVGWCCNCWSSVVVAVTNGSVFGFPVANTQFLAVWPCNFTSLCTHIAAVTKVLKAQATPTIAVRAMADMKIPTAPAAIPVKAAAAIPAAATLAVTVAEHPPAAIPAESPPNKIQFVQPQKRSTATKMMCFFFQK